MSLEETIEDPPPNSSGSVRASGLHAHWSGAPWRDDLGSVLLSRLEGKGSPVPQGLVYLDIDIAGLERMASDDPRAFQRLRELLDEGRAALASGSYSQSVAVIHGGESAVRQWCFGVRTALRLTGMRPRFYWPHEGGVFPQLPQILRQCGIEAASLYHGAGRRTPSAPSEPAEAVEWQAPDGSSIVLVTPQEGRLALAWFAKSAPGGSDLLEWLEGRNGLPVRRHTASAFWHGFTLPRVDDQDAGELALVEAQLLSWEAGSAMLSLFSPESAEAALRASWAGREGWKKLLAGQAYGLTSPENKDWAYAWRRSLLDQALTLSSRSELRDRFARYADLDEGEELAVNTRGWERPIPNSWRDEFAPSFGWKAAKKPNIRGEWTSVLGVWRTSEGSIKAEVDLDRGVIWVAGPDCPEGFQISIPVVQWMEGDVLIRESDLPDVDLSEEETESGLGLSVLVARWPHHYMRLCLDPGSKGLMLMIVVRPRAIDSGYQGGIKVCWDVPVDVDEIRCDTPFAVEAAQGGAPAVRRYPIGEPGSPVWSDVVEKAFTSCTFLNLRKRRSSLLLAHSHHPQWVFEDFELRHLVGVHDPFDDQVEMPMGSVSYCIIPHRIKSDAECWQAAATMARIEEFQADPMIRAPKLDPTEAVTVLLPRSFSALQAVTPGISITALFREKPSPSGSGLEGYAGRMIQFPFVARIVEFDGTGGEAQIRVAGTVVKAYKTNILGEVEDELSVRSVVPEAGDPCHIRGRSSLITFPLRGHEIATIYMDILEGRLAPARPGFGAL